MGYKKRKLRADLQEIATQKNLTAQMIADAVGVCAATVRYCWFRCRCEPNDRSSRDLAALLGIAEEDLYEKENG